jgi:hypothetical protein
MPLYAPQYANAFENDTFDEATHDGECGPWVNHADGCGGDGEYTACGFAEGAWSLGTEPEMATSILLEDQPEYKNHKPSRIITCPGCIESIEDYFNRFKKTKDGWIQVK